MNDDEFLADLVKTHRARADRYMYMGVAITDMSRDQLLSVIVSMMQRERLLFDQYSKALEDMI